jgi:hypothetical protein
VSYNFTVWKFDSFNYFLPFNLILDAFCQLFIFIMLISSSYAIIQGEKLKKKSGSKNKILPNWDEGDSRGRRRRQAYASPKTTKPLAPACFHIISMVHQKESAALPARDIGLWVAGYQLVLQYRIFV